MAGRLAGFLMLLGLASQGQWLRAHNPRALASPAPPLPTHHLSLRSAGPAPACAGKMKVVEEPNTFG